MKISTGLWYKFQWSRKKISHKESRERGLECQFLTDEDVNSKL